MHGTGKTTYHGTAWYRKDHIPWYRKDHAAQRGGEHPLVAFVSIVSFHVLMYIDDTNRILFEKLALFHVVD